MRRYNMETGTKKGKLTDNILLKMEKKHKSAMNNVMLMTRGWKYMDGYTGRLLASTLAGVANWLWGTRPLGKVMIHWQACKLTLGQCFHFLGKRVNINWSLFKPRYWEDRDLRDKVKLWVRCFMGFVELNWVVVEMLFCEIFNIFYY